ncbi:MAG: hypothetical protein IPN03_18875 [Holophagales bacterium]|nr:hypothetical protein [Holophagales bacterium]
MAPTVPVPEQRPERHDVARPPERNYDRPTPVPTPKVGTWIAPEPRRQRVETAPVPASPVEPDVRKAEPRRAAPATTEPGKAEPKKVEEGPTATPRPKRETTPQPRRVEPDGTRG